MITYVANFIWSFFVTYCLPLDLRYSSKLPFDINSVTIFIVRFWLSNTIPRRQTRLSCCNELEWNDLHKLSYMLTEKKKLTININFALKSLLNFVLNLRHNCCLGKKLSCSSGLNLFHSFNCNLLTFIRSKHYITELAFSKFFMIL